MKPEEFTLEKAFTPTLGKGAITIKRDGSDVGVRGEVFHFEVRKAGGEELIVRFRTKDGETTLTIRPTANFPETVTVVAETFEGSEGSEPHEVNARHVYGFGIFVFIDEEGRSHAVTAA